MFMQFHDSTFDAEFYQIFIRKSESTVQHNIKQYSTSTHNMVTIFLDSPKLQVNSVEVKIRSQLNSGGKCSHTVHVFLWI